MADLKGLLGTPNTLKGSLSGSLIPGPKGDKGDKGERGPQGEKGEKGDKGDKGDTGDTGPQGPRGETGERGPTGETGAQGPQGEIGPAGPKGDTGEQGPKGDMGPAGPTGPKGDKGDPGEISFEQFCKVFPTDTVSGAVASFPDGADDIPLKSCIVQIEPVQSGSGDPSPENVRPITGWTGCEIVRANANLWNDDWYTLGNVMSLITDETNDFYGYYNGSVKRWDSAQAENGNMMLFPNGVDRLTVTFEAGCILTGSGFTFKVFFHYTDGTVDSAGGNATLNPREKKTVVRASTIGKKCTGFLISTIAGTGNNGGAVRRIMVGANDNRDIIAPVRTTYPITFPTEADIIYGARADVIGGELAVDGKIVDLETFTPSVRYVGDVNKTISITLPESYIGYGTFRGFVCSTYAVKGGVSSASDLSAPDNKDVGIYKYSNVTKPETKTVYFVMPKDLALNGELVFFTTVPQTYPLIPTEIKTLLGQNNIWSNTGDTTVEYAADIQRYITKKSSEIMTN